MFKFTGKERKSDLKILTEQEIQDKLYGRYLKDKKGETTATDEENSTDKFLFKRGSQASYEPDLVGASFGQGGKTRGSLSRLWDKTAWFRLEMSEFSHKLKRGTRRLVRNKLFLGIFAACVLIIVFNFALNNAKDTRINVTPVIPQQEDIVSETETNLPATPLPPPAREESKADKVIRDGQKYFTIQMCVFKNEKDAKSLAKKLKSDGYEVTSEEFKSRRGSTFYRVDLGRFETYAKASAYLEKNRNTGLFKEFADSFVRAGS